MSAAGGRSSPLKCLASPAHRQAPAPSVQEAKARVYKVIRNGAPPRAEKGAGSAGPALEAVLEEQPKWLLLREIAEEVQAQRGAILSLQSTSAAGGASAHGGVAAEVRAAL